MAPRRTTKRTIAVIASVLVVVTAAVLARGQFKPPTAVWYHASDVAMLAQTGRPQLVEFFHPD